jgi:protein ImuA
MAGARMTTLASLRGAVARLETAGCERLSARVPLGHAEADDALKGGLALGALHEVFAEEGRQGTAASGFALGLVRRVTQNRRFVLWITQNFAGCETGDLAMPGFVELGLDPRFIIAVRADNAEMALRAAADGLSCNALGAVVTELWGEPKAFDAVASRKLTLAAGNSGVTGVMLRLAAAPEVSTAETRWIVRAARSPPSSRAAVWGAPAFDAELVRNRHGPTGRWIMHWNCDAHLFKQDDFEQRAFGHEAASVVPVVAAAADRPLQAGAAARQIAGGVRRAAAQ